MNNTSPNIIVTILRIAVGWHFLFEGITKLFVENWTAKNYLMNSTGFLSNFYHWLANSDNLLSIIDFINVYGLIVIGLGLFLGFLLRYFSIFGIILLALYYFAYPPFGQSFMYTSTGHFFIVNFLLIEIIILIFISINPQSSYGIDTLIKIIGRKDSKLKNENQNEIVEKTKVGNSSRREAIKSLVSLPLLGVFGWGVLRRKEIDVDVMSGATIKFANSTLDKLEGKLPTGKIGNIEISRLVAGGNLIGGWAHSRDLIYVPSLFKAYNTEKKIYETLILAEKAGINTINIGFASNPILQKYKKITGSKLNVISQVAPDMDKGDYFVNINKAIDYGAEIIQVQGNWCDWLVRDNKFDIITQMLEKIRMQGYPAGLASHTIDSLIECKDRNIIPDYYMKTMHHDNYWSAHPMENRKPFEVDGERHTDHNKFHDNIFCLYPDKTIKFVQEASVPVMGFKVLAAGAIEPQDGFHWAFQNGADFICVGMFDFQIVDDVNIAIKAIASTKKRIRPWYA